MTQPVETLYHYTTGSALMSILGEQSIWATDARYLNDAAEFTLGRAELNDALLDAAEIIAARDPRDELDESPTLIAEFVRGQVSDESLREPAPFIACFCTDGDLLSQWRAYGGGAYCVGFDRDSLEKIRQPERVLYLGGRPDAAPGISDSSPRLVPVRYGQDGVRQMVAEVVAEYLALTAPPRYSNWYSSRLPAYVGRSSVKHEAFSSELEWRLVIAPDFVDERYRPDNRGALLPYVPLRFDRAAVKSIRIGPTMHPEAHDSVRRFLAQRGYTDVDVTHSGAPVR
ncbi:DUF2971 domain-containing protein [Cellulomonas dongxiuzhuiae]|uniref:DUF2971 domain-containing protein n=1 Tax=Cellulomonas dongxiuzhuiae TaxID=2819979 RepID=A0ABX8GL46_9CELL|nr:DUF2971 domain-containing protein [Cellulomonas dongxiuzhuiae]MBO3095450.1 DUF2971 domain-containing protein [Cellulomonas dongxiuzhuiae]QWC16432.1 DUF2971 domain-containing protein [Cellulomonas dongxiuzhuiae]